MNGMVDLNGLLAKCYDERSRELLREAIDCYNGGSFRAAILMTWMAVVCDYFYKLEELGQKGEIKAKTESDAFIMANEQLEKAKLLKFENELVAQARDVFTFISVTEASELERLYEDRHRCAHPRIMAGHQVYAPTAEQARYHLRNAVDILLSVPPTMGKAGIEEIWQLVESKSFPVDWNKAKEALRNSNLDRLRPESQLELLMQLLITPICEPKADDLLLRIFAASNALSEMKPLLFDKVKPRVNKKVASLLDEQRARIYMVMSFVPTFKSILNTAEIDRCNEFAKHLDVSSQKYEITCAAKQPEFVMSILTLVSKLDNETLAGVIKANAHVSYRNEAVQRLTPDWAHSYNLGDAVMEQLLIPCAALFSESEIKEIMAKASSNSQVRDTSKASSLFYEFCRGCTHHSSLKAEWQAFADRNDFSRLRTLADTF